MNLTNEQKARIVELFLRFLGHIMIIGAMAALLGWPGFFLAVGMWLVWTNS